jgi:hypothetical protein
MRRWLRRLANAVGGLSAATRVVVATELHQKFFRELSKRGGGHWTLLFPQKRALQNLRRMQRKSGETTILTDKVILLYDR